MYLDAIKLLYTTKLDLSNPSHMLQFLSQDPKNPLFILFLEAEDPDKGWTNRETEITDAVKNVFDQDSKNLHRVMFVESGKNGWTPDAWQLRQTYNITTIPTLLRFDIITINNLNYIHRKSLIGVSECTDPIKLAAIRDDQTAAVVPGPCKRLAAEVMKKDKDGKCNGGDDPWEWVYVGPKEAKRVEEQMLQIMWRGLNALEGTDGNDGEGGGEQSSSKKDDGEEGGKRKSGWMHDVFVKPWKALKRMTVGVIGGGGGWDDRVVRRDKEVQEEVNDDDGSFWRQVEQLFGYVRAEDEVQLLPVDEDFVDRIPIEGEPGMFLAADRITELP
ncbi:hypothetical protein AA313_de0210058 [Arthrobotrys entomopaga]|nr:hypothetical protein AA313_de0210058 [Arthrobotrys entomopaga]